MSSTTNSYWHRIAVRRAGSRDGRDSIPAKDDKHVSPYENELLDRGVLHVGQIEERFAQRIQAARAARESAIAELDATVTRYEEVMHRFADHWSGRDVIAHLSRTTYLWLLAAAGIGEFVLNMQAFNIFGYPLFFTALISLAVAITIPVLAHWAGMVLRQGMRPWSRTVIMIACVASACAGLYGITQARAEYLLHRGVVAEASLLEHAFFLINAMIFVAACAMSFFCHDTDENLEQLHHWAIRLDTDVDRIDRSIDQLAGRIDGLTSQRAAEVEQVHAAIRQLVNLYRRENIRRRSSDDRPVVFHQPPVLPIIAAPATLQSVTDQDALNCIRDRRKAAMRAVTLSRSDVGRPAGEDWTSESAEVAAEAGYGDGRPETAPIVRAASLRRVR